jgi:hypothetical protein
MMSLLVAFALAFTPAFPSLQEESITLNVPDDISPAMDLYIRCRLQSVGATMSDKQGKPMPALVEKGGDCTAIRTKAVADADAALAQEGKKDGARAKLIARTVKSIDEFAEAERRLMASAAEKAGAAGKKAD